jgi:ribosomal 50S subunit-recycling heat shock protein
MTLHHHLAAILGDEPASLAILRGRVRVNGRVRKQTASAVRVGDVLDVLDGDLPVRVEVKS